MPPALWIVAIEACSVPVNDSVRSSELLFTTGEMVVNVVPLAWTSSKTADPWYPVGHPSVVDQVGVLLVEPEVALRWTAPGSVPKEPPAGPPPRSRAPTRPPTSPRASAGGRSPSILGDFSFRNFIGYLPLGFISRTCDPRTVGHFEGRFG